MSHEIELPQITKVFLSATAQDCKDYREAVSYYVNENLPVKIPLQKNWADGGKFVVDVCEQKVNNCDAYFGLFGHRYGWIPPGHTKSITELEFRWAVNRWLQREPPIFILLPEKDSEADQQLKQWAKDLLPDEAERTIDAHAQQAFLNRVKQWVAERMLVIYRNKIELTIKAGYCLLIWRNELLSKALDGRRSAVGDIPADELGRIGRESQLQVLGKTMDAFSNHDQERAITFLVHGPENHGQREFADFLYRWEDWEESTQVFCGQASELDNIDSLICWACGQLQEPMLGTVTVEGLANILAARFACKSVVFIVRSLGRRSDRLTTFLNQLWKPLMDALPIAPPASKLRRLYWFVIDHAELQDDETQEVWRDAPDAGNVDYHKLLPLPPLDEIKAIDVRRWLKELSQSKVISVNEELREAIAQRVTQPDGIPPNVYNRLALEGFWA